jgi:trk system potassium uptake protein TrkA
MAITALAGPLSNLLLALWLLFGVRVMIDGNASMAWIEFLLDTAVLSLGLGVFNLIPIPPLDGSKIVAALLPDACVVQGDASDQNLLESEGLDSSDALVTLTGLDELNMIISLYGASREVPQVITKLGHMGNLKIIDALALGSIVSPKELCCNNIVRYVRAMQNQTGAAVSVHAIADGQVEAVEFRVDEATRNCGIPLKELKLKPNVLIASITHGAQSEVPSGNSVFQKGDTVVVVTSGRGVLHQLNDIFA